MGQGDINLNLPEGENFIPAPEKIAAMEALLGPEPYHLGRPSADRTAWDPWREHPVGRHFLAEAERLSAPPLTRITNDLLRRSHQQDRRAGHTEVSAAVRARLHALVMAECLEPSGRYLESIADEIAHFAGLVTWVSPAHDEEQRNLNEETIEIDLGSAQWAMLFVTIDFLLGDRLPEATRGLIRSEVERRIFEPFEERIRTGRDIYWWVTCDHNWNTVCVNCVLGCALWLKESRLERAWHLALADDLIQYSNRGFAPSGFYTEGLSYWAYGFGNYVTISELVRGATGGRIDWLGGPVQNRMARYGIRMEMLDGIYPTFADSHMDSAPTEWLTHWLNNRIEPDPARVRSTTKPIDAFSGLERQSLSILLLNLFHTEEGPDYRLDYDFPRREWFDDVQFLICRPDPATDSRTVASLLGGHNGVNHNHNDLGTFTVAVDGRYLICDPGLETYTNRTFSANRYEGNLLSSFGHPVPVVAGQLQRPGKCEYTSGIGSQYRAAVIETSFSEDEDRVVLDLSKAYRVESLSRLDRTFLYRRSSPRRVEVEDRVKFERPESFETAIITYANWSLKKDGNVRIGDGDAAIRVKVSSDTGSLVFAHEVIEESSRPTRLSWRLREPAGEACLRIEVEEVS